MGKEILFRLKKRHITSYLQNTIIFKQIIQVGYGLLIVVAMVTFVFLF